MIQMNHRLVEPKARVSDGLNGSEARLAYAKQMLEEMAVEAVLTKQNGTIGIEIPVKDGRFGKVKRLSITFQRE